MRTGASNALPSRRARNASVTSAAVRTFGGGAGTSIQRALSRQIASTMPVSAERVSARASTLGSMASTLPGISSARRLHRSVSTSAGVQRTENDALELLAAPRRRRRCRSSGTIAPRAVSSTAQIATRPSHRTLGRDVVDLSGAGRDQPTQHLADRCRERGRGGTARQRHRGVMDPRRRRRPGGPEHRHDRIAVDGGVARSRHPRRRPVPVPTTPAPGAHRRVRVPPVRGGSGPAARCARRRARRRPRSAVNRDHAADSRRRSDCASASTWSRSSPRSALLVATNSSASREEPQQGRAPSRPIGLEDRELVGGGVTVGLGLDPQVELPRRDLGGRR